MTKPQLKLPKDTILMSTDTLLNELMFCAARYCIGRHSYVSSYARDYWNIIRHNRDEFNEERLQFFARDIMSEISNHMNWWKNVHTEEAYNCSIKYDSYYLLSKYLCEHPDCVFEKTDFNINCLTGEVIASERKEPVEIILSEKMPETDLEQWSCLASAISRQLTVEVKGSDKYQAIECYEQVRYNKDEDWHWEKQYRLVDNWNQIINEEYITSVSNG